MSEFFLDFFYFYFNVIQTSPEKFLLTNGDNVLCREGREINVPSSLRIYTTPNVW